MINHFRKGDNDNVLYMTSCCNNHCLMCCQPPKKEDESAVFLQHNLKLLREADADTDYVCITGGEPTLHEETLFATIRSVREHLAEATIHLLSNGRRFSDVGFLTRFVRCAKGPMMLGIPLHADNALDHDLIAGAKGSFIETMKGLHNLGLLGFQVELRVILLQQNVKRLPKIAEFIALNLPFVNQVSIMGLEITGFAESNYRKVWVDPVDCKDELMRAVSVLESARIHTRLFNMPLCLLSPVLWPYAAQSISAWKKSNVAQCRECRVREQCCGVFATSRFLSPHIKAI